MKKSVSLLLITALVLSILVTPERSFAEEDEKEKANPTITCEWRNNNKTLVIKGEGRLTYGWTRKVKKWYSSCNRLVIQRGITSISPNAFEGMELDIESVKLPEGLTVLENIFSNHCFYQGFKKVELPSTLEQIEKSAFAACDDLQSIEIPESVTYIGDCAFQDCTGLTSLEIPGSVTHIGKRAFHSCTALKKLTLPESLEEFQPNAIARCPSLKTVVNRSSLSIPLDNCKKRKTWYVNERKKNRVPAGRTAKAKGKKYKIRYDLKGGRAKCKLPRTYRYGSDLKLPGKKITRKGRYFLAWKVDKNIDNPDVYTFRLGASTHGTIKVSPIFIKYKVKNVKGKKIKISVGDHKKVDAVGFVVRYSTKRDMANAKYEPEDPVKAGVGYNEKENKYTLKKLKKGRRYYIEIAALYDDDEVGAWCGKRSVRVKK